MDWRITPGPWGRAKPRWRGIAFSLAVIGLAVIAGFAAGRFSVSDAEQWLSASTVSAPRQPSAPQTLIGRASVIDGDTIEIQGEHIRFNGIDAPESNQRCENARGVEYSCGRIASAALDDFLAASRPTRCEFIERDRFGRFVGNCYRADGESVASWLVRNGHAVDWPRHSMGAYSKEQETAKAERIGIWSGPFQPPWEWRAERQNTASETRPLTLIDQSEKSSANCTIKGNINARGERIYHVPGQRYYSETKIDPSRGERWFCSEDEARSAGWRRSRV